MDIVSLNEQDNIIASWRLIDLFPRSIAPIQASATNAQVLRMPVTFTYKKWQVIGGYQPDGSGVGGVSDLDREEPVDFELDSNDPNMDMDINFDDDITI
jgi:hypothetical protein